MKFEPAIGGRCRIVSMNRAGTIASSDSMGSYAVKLDPDEESVFGVQVYVAHSDMAEEE